MTSTHPLYRIAEGAEIPDYLAAQLGDLLDQAEAADTSAEAAAQAADLARDAFNEARERLDLADRADAALSGAKYSADKALGAFLRMNGLVRRAEGIMTMAEAEAQAAVDATAPGEVRTFGSDLAGGSYTRSDVI